MKEIKVNIIVLNTGEIRQISSRGKTIEQLISKAKRVFKKMETEVYNGRRVNTNFCFEIENCEIPQSWDSDSCYEKFEDMKSLVKAIKTFD